jgi:two-component sensor histidine kinase/CheY-like chemotaxis protein
MVNPNSIASQSGWSLADPDATGLGSQNRDASAEVDRDRINILIVDDEKKNLTVLETVLDDPAYRLVRAMSADQALLALIEQDFALIILDIRMPDITGFELAHMIKERKKTARIPIIFLTAYYGEPQYMVEAYGIGAVDYLQKPVNTAILRSKVAVFAELHRKRLAIERANNLLLVEIEARRVAEQQLRELNSSLELLVAQRTEHIRLLLNEVSHRSKNALSLVMAIARQTSATGVDDFLERFSHRMHALTTHYDLLVHNQWRSVDLATLVRAQLSHFADLIGGRIDIRGPSVQLTAAAAQSIGMAIHELATNAAKHGALLDDRGKVRINWTLDTQDQGEGTRLSLSWLESDGPAVTLPTRRGFGARVIKEMIEASLDGEVTLDYASSGLAWHLTCPSERLMVTVDSPSNTSVGSPIENEGRQ